MLMQIHRESEVKLQNKSGSQRLNRIEIDRKLLDILYLDSRKKLSEIAEILGVSVTSVHNRIRALEERGVIKKFTVQIDSEKIGNDLTAVISLEIKVNYLHEINIHLQSIPEIIALYNVTGDEDIIAICRFRDRQHLNKVIQEILKIEHITKTKTKIALQILKEEYHSPITAELTPELQDKVEKFNLLNLNEVGK